MQGKVQALIDESPEAGLAVALVEDGAIRVSCAGVFEGQSVMPDTVWPVASLTKPVFVYGVLQLVQQGLLELDRPLQSYLPVPYLDGIADLSSITARHAMSHSTGFPNWRDAEGLRTDFVPGSQFSYSSEGLNYLQAVAEHLVGTSMREYLRENVFVPFRMMNTDLRPETEDTLTPSLAFFLKTLPANGALSLHTTIEDYGRFMQAMFEPAAEACHLNESLLREMIRPQIGVGEYEQLHWGLGWGLQEQRGEWSFWHWGARGLPRTLNFAVGWPERKKAIVVFTQHADGLGLARTLIQDEMEQETLPAFEWLLPAKHWRPNGQKVV